MKKINIIKNQIITNSAQFETEELASEWLQREISNGSFGRNAQELIETPLQPVPEELKAIATSTEEVVTENGTFIKYFIPAEYTYEIIDISNELEKQAKLAQITQLESQITNRRLREAILTGDDSFIFDIEQQVQAIRSTL